MQIWLIIDDDIEWYTVSNNVMLSLILLFKHIHQSWWFKYRYYFITWLNIHKHLTKMLCMVAIGDEYAIMNLIYFDSRKLWCQVHANLCTSFYKHYYFFFTFHNIIVLFLAIVNTTILFPSIVGLFHYCFT